MRQMEAKKWFRNCILTLAGLLCLTALIVFLVDPYFHYHKPYPFLSCLMSDERYTNDGISRHFDFDALITGTSMAQNFKPSEMDALFGTNSVKEAFSGAGYQEIADNLNRALSRNKNITAVLWTLDYNGLLRDYDWAQYESYPVYLYDDNPFNDVSYLFNKSVFYHNVLPNLALTLSGSPGTTMDEYSSFQFETGLEQILASYDRDSVKPEANPNFTEEHAQAVAQTITANVTSVIERYPDVTFYIFYSPYSICYWDSLHLKGILIRQLQAEQAATELLLEYPNVKLYNFFDQYDVICNPDCYSDSGHYSAEINSRILGWIAEDTGLVTKENYLEKLAQEKEFYSSYDYDGIYD
ncbi:MAG: hypothetical protein NC400_00580 [Clostridium sp.]|nr:hypothetical protein [Clostridium sp.]